MKPSLRFSSIERLEDRIAPATFLVTSLFDNTNPGSLRVAIAEANAKPGPDTITFQAGLTGTLNLALGSLEITDPLTIKGPGIDKVEINGGNLLALFKVVGGHQTAISGLSLANAKSLTSGAAFSSDGPTTLLKVKISGSRHDPLAAGAPTGGALWIHTSGDIVIQDCIFVGNGSASTAAGGAADLATTNGKIVIKNSLVVANDANLRAGGILVALGDARTSLTVDRTTLSTNGVSADRGGALVVTSAGGAVTVRSSLFSDNQTSAVAFGDGGGAINQTGGSLTVTGTTFNGNQSVNGGAIAFQAGIRATIQKSIFTLNNALSVNATTPGGAVWLSNVTNWLFAGSSFTGNDALGGGGAVAIDGGMGKISGTSFLANRSGLRGGGALSLSNITAEITGSSFSLNDGGTAEGGAIVVNGGSLALSASVLSGNFSPDNGGALHASNAAVTIKGTTFTDNAADLAGGAIWTSGDLTVLGSTFRGNSADGDGGAIKVQHGAGKSLTIKASRLLGNAAGDWGGGVSVDSSGLVLLEKLLVTGNRSDSDGAGLYFLMKNGASATVRGSQLTGNATGELAAGGGIAITPGSIVVLTKNVITGNVARTGGGVFSFGTVMATGNRITGNSALIAPDTSGF